MFDKLEDNIVEIMLEQQIKIGYREEMIRLYYPLSSLNHFFKEERNAEEMYQLLREHFGEENEILGKVVVSYEEERFCFRIPETGVKYVHEQGGENEFLSEFIRTCEAHDCTIEQLYSVFRKYSDRVHFEEVTHGEFNYLLYFEDGQPDGFRYCITDEGCHFMYHRFTYEDYIDFAF